MKSPNDVRVFWGCFIALITCAFGFIIRTQIIGDWAEEFNLSEAEKGDILGVGFWPFAFSIFLLSLFIDRIGYGRAAAIGLVCHLTSTCILMFATGPKMLYWGTFIFALSNGTVEAYINPVVASMYSKEKTKWLNILHAGWPGGMVLAGIVGIAIADVDWHWKVGLTIIPTIVYGVLLLGTRFPVSERVAAGVSDRDMLRDFGAMGALIVVYLVSLQVAEGILHVESNKFLWPLLPAVVAAVGFGAYAKSWGSPLFFVLAIIMVPLATTELGVDSWITELMAPEMALLGLHAGWVLVYTAFIMTILRCFAGPIVHRLSPLGLLAVCSILAMAGLLLLSKASGGMILLAATVYGVGKTFFWPTMLGVVSERCPRGGALTLNSIGGIGMLGLSVGMVFLGAIQDKQVDADLRVYDQVHESALHDSYVTLSKSNVFGEYEALDLEQVREAPEDDRLAIEGVQAAAKKNALFTAAVFPLLMFVCYVALILYFQARGGYRAASLVDEPEKP